MAEFDLIGIVFILIATLILVLINGFMVAAEFALVSVRPSKVEELIQKTGSKRAKAVKKAIENQDEVISATQLGITMASLGLGYLAGSFIEPMIEEVFHDIGFAALLGGLAIGGALAFALTTYAHVVIGELAPKSIALQYPAKTSLWVARPLHLFTFLFKPVIWFFNQTGWLILAIFGIKPMVGHRAHSEDELKMLITQSSDAGILDERETAILTRTFDLPDTLIRSIMTSRREMVVVSLEDDFEDIIRTINASGHSRLPCVRKDPINGASSTTEEVVGFLYAKDLLRYLELSLETGNSLDGHIDVSELLREADIFVPETMRADRLLEIFQSKRKHSGIVVDEFGELVGLITLEDILELLVGDIQDEFDFEPAEITPAMGGETKVNGQTSLDDFNSYFKTDFSSDISVTIGGLIIEKIGRLPEHGETYQLNDLLFTAKEVTKSRIVTLLLHRETEKESTPLETIELKPLEKKED